ncbi:cell division protein ZapE [Microbacterium sp. STN6]|uniref:cell division protein ZapE n=1 Tax=Microbacterium sp. STN6 TaxID=2995588 RepID=UPI002260DD00|nr:cell division protein ZapE [Microbacterium sp. STN6]MCX7521247.1 cell division protein ZapE [Microbacterium sp. STN6]
MADQRPEEAASRPVADQRPEEAASRPSRRLVARGETRDPFASAAASAGFALDPAQRTIAERLTWLGTALRDAEPGAPAPRGIYLWGPAGRGKTWLLDTFEASQPAGRVRRIHFHGFFRELHESIQRNRQQTDAAANAIEAAIDELLGGASLLHFEEFHVHDSGNAALLVRLLEALFAKGVTLIASSNYAPADLFADPEFHYVFRPGIALITQHLDVLELDGGVDYRRAASAASPDSRRGFANGRWLVRAAGGQPSRDTPPKPEPHEAVVLTVDGRSIRARRADRGAVWFTFDELLEESTAVSDYLTLSARYRSWVLDEVPDFARTSAGARQRFVNLIDVLCDLDIELTVIAATTRDALGSVDDLPADMPRTLSRLALLG